jgi:DHA1 family inner membrane transport protein
MARRTLLIALAGISTAGNLLAAVSTGYEMLMAARILTSLNHGAFFGVGSIVAASLVPAERRAGAVAAMFMGLTIANGSAPPRHLAGGHLGWRVSFRGLAALGVVTMTALRSLCRGGP